MALVGMVFVSSASAQSSRNDPLLKTREAKKQVDDTEARVLQSLQELERLASQQAFGDWRNEKLVIDEFRTRLIPSLKKAATDLLARKEDFDKKFKMYQAAVKKAPAAFDAAAKQFQQYADNEDDAAFKENYLDMELHAKKWAREMEQRHGRLDEMYKEVTDKTQFVEKSVVFLDRLDEFLQIYPDPDKAAEVQQYLQKLNNHIEQIRRAINSFKDFSKSMTDPTQQKPTVPPEQKSAVAPEPRYSTDASLIPSSPHNRRRVIETVAVHRAPAMIPASSNKQTGRVTAVSEKRYDDGIWFDITFDDQVTASPGDMLTLRRLNGDSLTVKVRATRDRELLAATKSPRPRIGDHLSIEPLPSTSAAQTIARR